MRPVLQLVIALALNFVASSASLSGVEITSYPFTDWPDGRSRVTVSMKGAITGNDLQTLQRQIARERSPYVVVLIESPGGDWNAALALGRYMRNIGAAVQVTEGGCYSSCVLELIRK